MTTVDVGISIFSFALSYVSLCRLNKSRMGRTRVAFQLRYLLVFVGAFCSALSPWLFPRHEDLGQLILLTALVASQLATSSDWRAGAPDYTLKKGRS